VNRVFIFVALLFVVSSSANLNDIIRQNNNSIQVHGVNAEITVLKNRVKKLEKDVRILAKFVAALMEKSK